MVGWSHSILKMVTHHKESGHQPSKRWSPISQRMVTNHPPTLRRMPTIICYSKFCDPRLGESAISQNLEISFNFCYFFPIFCMWAKFLNMSDFIACSQNLWTTQIPCNNMIIHNIGFMVLKTTGLNPVFEKYSPSPEILAKMYLGCSEISATSNKIRPWKMKMVLSKMLISSKVMHRYCWNLE